MTSNRRKASAPSKKSYVKGAKSNESQTAEQYLEAGVELEEAGEKWRAGDSTKALRFFSKALDQYAVGLGAFPRSFDLAYNKARLQYDITQQPRLLKQIPDVPVTLLRQAAESHVFALALDDGNTDALFNLAQVYSSIAEAVLEGPNELASDRAEASHLLQQALEILERCLKIQEQGFAEAKELSMQELPSSPEKASRRPSEEGLTAGGGEEEVWASVIAPVTEETLLDTCLAQLQCLKSLCSLQSLDCQDELALIEDKYGNDLKQRTQHYTQTCNHKRDVLLAQASFLAGYANARFRLRRTDVRAFNKECNSAIAIAETLTGIKDDAEALCMVAEAHIDCNASIEERTSQLDHASRQEMAATSRIRWTHITVALYHYTAATKVPNVLNLARIHTARGDCELLRTRLIDEPFRYELALDSEITLVKNANVYYNVASKVLPDTLKSPESAEDKAEVDFKVALTSALQRKDFNPMNVLLAKNKPDVQQRFAEMRENHLVGGSAWAFFDYMVQSGDFR